SSVYLTVFFFINFFAFPPIACADNTNGLATIGEADSENAATRAPANAEKTRLAFAVTLIHCHHEQRIGKRALRFAEINAVLGKIGRFFVAIPFEPHPGHSRSMANCQYFLSRREEVSRQLSRRAGRVCFQVALRLRRSPS